MQVWWTKLSHLSGRILITWNFSACLSSAAWKRASLVVKYFRCEVWCTLDVSHVEAMNSNRMVTCKLREWLISNSVHNVHIVSSGCHVRHATEPKAPQEVCCTTPSFWHLMMSYHIDVARASASLAFILKCISRPRRLRHAVNIICDRRIGCSVRCRCNTRSFD